MRTLEKGTTDSVEFFALTIKMREHSYFSTVLEKNVKFETLIDIEIFKTWLNVKNSDCMKNSVASGNSFVNFICAIFCSKVVIS